MKLFANAHEYGTPRVTANAEIIKDTIMDLSNNKLGRGVGVEVYNSNRQRHPTIVAYIVKEKVKKLADDGKLVTVR